MSAARAIIVVGLGFGDEGKGSVVDALTRRFGARLVVRFNGGPQAAHHVVAASGAWHRFAQLGSGSLVSGVRTYLSRFMIVDPIALRAEAQVLAGVTGRDDILAGVAIDPRAIVVTPFHRILGCLEEDARGAARHGSCGLGVGLAARESQRPGSPTLRLGEARDRALLQARLRLMWLAHLDRAEQLAEGGGPHLKALLTDLARPDRVAALTEAYHAFAQEITLAGDEIIDAALRGQAPVIFEGAQGALLDEGRGFSPYVTKARTGFQNALELVTGRLEPGAIRRLGVLRGYLTRHGPGPFVTEDAALGAKLPEPHNGPHPYQGPFRVGWLDLVMLRYAIASSGGADALALNHLDRIGALDSLKLGVSYRDLGAAPATSFFESRGHRQVNIRLTPEVDKAHQAELTRRLLSCRPDYEELDASAAALQGALERALDVPCGLVSWGPRASDKAFVPGVL